LAQNYFFRVYGTNRTVKQSVVFTGNLLVNTVVTTNMYGTFQRKDDFSAGEGGGGGAEGEKKLEPTNQVTQLPWSQLRITGTAVVNDTNQIQINAAPVSPVKN
jgi:hypothetical protein